jgi:hypothetical protein
MANINLLDKDSYISVVIGRAGYADLEVARMYNDPASPAFEIGNFSSATEGQGIPVTKNLSKAFGVYADDSAGALVAGAAVRAFQARTLLAHAGASVDASAYGSQSHAKVTADISSYTGIIGGSWNYLEMASGGHVNQGGACVVQLDVPSGAYAAGNVAGVYIKSNSLAGTHTGKICMIYGVNSLATAWDAFLGLDSASDVCQDSAAGSAGYKYLKVYYGGVLYTIQMARA